MNNTIPKCLSCGAREGFALFVATTREAYGEAFTDSGMQCNACGAIFKETDLDWEEEPNNG
jgi:hypothetical protein